MRYILPAIYRGIQIEKVCIAKSDAAASRLFDVSIYQIRNYAMKCEPKEIFDGVKGCMNSGPIIFEAGRKDLHSKLLPIDELKNIIDAYRDVGYKKWQKQFS